MNALDSLGLTIMDARIITSVDGFSLDTYIVLDEHGTPSAKTGRASNRSAKPSPKR